MKKLYAILVTLFMSSQTYAQGIDFNPAFFGCAMGGGSCLTHTGIKVVDTFMSMFLGGYDVNMGHYDTYEYKKWEIENGLYSNSWGEQWERECRKLKEEYYLKISNFNPDSARDYQYQRSEYLQEYIAKKRANAIWDIFECTDAQRKIYLKSKLEALQKQFGRDD